MPEEEKKYSEWEKKVKQSRRNWEKLSKMDSAIKVKREMGRFNALWKLVKQEPWSHEIEDKFATIAYEFFEKNPFRTIVDARAFEAILFPQTKTFKEHIGSILFNQGIESLMVNPEGYDVEQIEYPYHYSDEPYQDWPDFRAYDSSKSS